MAQLILNSLLAMCIERLGAKWTMETEHPSHTQGKPLQIRVKEHEWRRLNYIVVPVPGTVSRPFTGAKFTWYLHRGISLWGSAAPLCEHPWSLVRKFQLSNQQAEKLSSDSGFHPRSTDALPSMGLKGLVCKELLRLRFVCTNGCRSSNSTESVSLCDTPHPCLQPGPGQNI